MRGWQLRQGVMGRRIETRSAPWLVRFGICCDTGSSAAQQSQGECGDVCRPPWGAHHGEAHTRHRIYAIASSPLCFTSDRSLSDGPDGFFSPRSHCETSVTVTLR